MYLSRLKMVIIIVSIYHMIRTVRATVRIVFAILIITELLPIILIMSIRQISVNMGVTVSLHIWKLPGRMKAIIKQLWICSRIVNRL